MPIDPLAGIAHFNLSPVLIDAPRQGVKIEIAPVAASTNDSQNDIHHFDHRAQPPLPSEEGDPVLADTLQKLKEEMQSLTLLQFDFDPRLRCMVMSILDKRTGDVLRTIPSEVAIKIATVFANPKGWDVDQLV